MLLKNKLKKPLALLISISLFVSPFNVYGQNIENGKFSKVEKGKTVPFDAWCFDDNAFAKINTALQLKKKECALYASRLLEEMKADYQLEIGKLELRVESIEKEYNGIVNIKDKEIKELQETALKRPNDNSIWWVISGFAVGTLMTSAVVYISHMQMKD